MVRMNARGDHYLALFGQDGVFYLYRNLDDALTLLGSWTYADAPSPTGRAEVLFAAQGDQMLAYVDGQSVAQASDPTLATGMLAYALASGSNRDFGTRCQMSSVDLWLFTPDSTSP